MAADYKTITYEKEGRIAIFTVNRPEVLNAINLRVRQELTEAMTDFRDDTDLWVGIVTGAGDRAFSAGADIKEISTPDAEAQQSDIMRGFELWKPLVAAIHGYCLGGGLELALACDILIAADNSSFGFAEIQRGWMPGWGGTQKISRGVPRAWASEILLMAKFIDAQEAYRMGLINKVVARDQLMSTAKEWAGTIAQAAPLGVRAAKEAMIRGYDMTLEQGFKLEAEVTARVIKSSEDREEGRKAFLEKKKPVWKGR